MKKLLLILFSAILIFSCSTEDFNQSESENPNIELRNTGDRYEKNGSDESTMERIFRFRTNLAISITNVPINKRQLLFSTFERLALAYESSGHYEQEFFLFKELDNIQPELSGTIRDFLVESDPSVVETLNYLCENDPAISILLHKVGAVSDYSNKVYVDNEYEDQDPNGMIDYAENGVSSLINAIQEPTLTSFVIREAECSLRPEEIAYNLSLDFPMDTKEVFIGSCQDYITIYNYPPFDPSDGPDTGDPDDGDTCLEECNRDCVDCKENMRRFRTTKDYDGWGKGRGEWNWYVIYAEDVDYDVDENGNVDINGDALKYVIKRSEGVRENDEWRYENFDIIKWDLDRPDSDRMKYVLYEDDKGRNRDIEIPFKLSLKIKIFGQEATPSIDTKIPIRITKGDDFIGESIVDYCDNIGFEYHPNSHVDFGCNERCY